jgi:hypothetical protein
MKTKKKPETGQPAGSITMTIRLPRGLRSEIERHAKESGRTTNNLINWLLENFVRLQQTAERSRTNPGFYEDDNFSEAVQPKGRTKEKHGPEKK